MEHKIIAASIADRPSFDRIDPHLDKDDLSPEGGVVLREIRKFYRTDPKATSVDLGIIKRAVARSLSNPKHKDVFKIYFDYVAEQDISAANVVADLLATKRDALQLALAESIFAKDTHRVNELLLKLHDLQVDEDLDGAVHEEYQNLDADELLEVFDKDHLIKVSPPSLNENLRGGVLRGHHIVIVAYPETGKTLMALTMMAGFVYQGLKVLYVGNEDPIKSIVLRFINNLTRRNAEAVAQDPESALALARQRGYDNAVFAGLSGGTLEDIKALVSKHDPDVLIIDQIRNLSVSAENRTQQLEVISRGVRNMAREFDLVAVSITQGADSARGKKVLDMGDVDGSNVGIPGTADVMVMIGMDADYEQANRRMLTLAKNKIGGIHKSWPIGVRPELSAVRDYGTE